VSADLLITNGRRWQRAPYTDVAVRSGRIVAIGTADALRDFRGPSTRVIDANGLAVLPSFQDAHIHANWGGLSMMRCNLHAVVGRDAVRQVIATYSTEHPAETWILGSGWEVDAIDGSIDKAFLDEVVSVRPVFLMSAGGHDGWVNSAALAAAGIDRETPDPSVGRPISGWPGG
jgi:predicted amidohydrolase YtcJ